MDRKKLTEIAINIGETIGIGNITRERLCSDAGIPDGSFTHIIGETFREFITRLEFDHAPINKSRLAPEFRRLAVMESAVIIARRDGWLSMTRDSIAETASISPAMVSYVLGDMDEVRRLVLQEAIKRELVSILAEALTGGEPEALKISKKLRNKVNKYITRL